jgi:hypothetical protein
MLRKFAGAGLLVPAAAAATIVVGLLANPASPAVAAVGGHAPQAPTARLVRIPAQVRRLMSDDVAKGKVIKPAMTAAGIPVFDVTSAGTLAGVHACLSLGSDGTNQGVECADLYATPDGNGGVDVFPYGEAFCNHGSDYPRCANVTVYLNVNDATGLGSPHDKYVCGHSAGNCVNNGRNYFIGLDFIDLSGCGGVGTASEVWTVDWTGSDIELPGSGLNVTSTANLGSGHAIVCP